MTILVVDDDVQVSALLAEALERSGYQVRVAHTLQEARAALGPFAMILADVRLPNGDGRHLRESFPDVPFVTMSGFHGEAPDLPKPFSVGQLREKIRELIGGSHG